MFAICSPGFCYMFQAEEWVFFYLNSTYRKTGDRYLHYLTRRWCAVVREGRERSVHAQYREGKRERNCFRLPVLQQMQRSLSDSGHHPQPFTAGKEELTGAVCCPALGRFPNLDTGERTGRSRQFFSSISGILSRRCFPMTD